MGDSSSFYVENKHTFMILAKLRNDVSLMDIAFTFKDNMEIYAHKAIVCQYSPLLSTKCANSKGLVKINFDQLSEEIETKPAHLNYLLDFMYFQNVTIKASDMQNTIKLAVYLNIVEFLSAANQQIKPLSLEKMITNIKEEPLADPVSTEPYEDHASSERMESDTDYFPLDTDPVSPDSDPISSTSGMVASQSGMQLPLDPPAEVNGEVFETKFEPADGTEEYQSLLEVKKPESLLKKSVAKKVTIKKISTKRPTTSKRKRTTKVTADIPVEDDDSATDDYDDTYDDDPNDEDFTVDGAYVNNDEADEYLADDIKSEDEDAPKQKKKKSSPSKAKKQTNKSVAKKKPTVPNMTKIDELGVRKCVECNEIFDTWPEVGQHRVDVHKRHACLICSKSFPDEPALIRHNVLHTDGILLERDGWFIYKCKECPQFFEAFDTPSDLNQHMKGHHSDYFMKCDDCEMPLTYSDGKNQYYKHRLAHKNIKPNKCSICDAAFIQARDLKVHRYKKHGINFYQKSGELYNPEEWQCDLCGQVYARKTSLEYHILSQHSGLKKTFHCALCSLSYYTEDTLKIHVKEAHEQMSVCDICGAEIRMENLKQHLSKIHAQKKCLHCLETYETLNDLKRHVEKHKECYESSKGLFTQCKLCPKLFTRENALQKHINNIHNPDKKFKCNQCEKAYSTMYRLNDHMLCHTKSISCTYCDKKFSYNKDLKAHLNIHLGIYPFKCEICGKAFTHNGGLYRHKQTHRNTLNDIDKNETL